jgi:transcriptional regulator with XRE-family HTH domain
MLHPVGTPHRDLPPPPRPLLRTTLGSVLRRARHEQRRTLAEVSRTARVSMQYLSELERGRKEASSEVLAALCQALGLDLAELLAEVGRRLTEDAASRAPVIRLRNLAADPAGTAAPATPPRALGSGEVLALLAA